MPSNDKVDYTKLQVGRELDELVLQKVAGWSKLDCGNGDWFWLNANGYTALASEYIGHTPAVSKNLNYFADIIRPYLDSVWYSECLSKLLFPKTKISFYTISIGNEAMPKQPYAIDYIWALATATPYQCCIAALQAVDLKYEIDNGLVSEE